MKNTRDFKVRLTQHACIKVKDFLGIDIPEFGRDLMENSYYKNIVNDYTKSSFPLWVQMKYESKKKESARAIEESHMLYIKKHNVVVILNEYLTVGITLFCDGNASDEAFVGKHSLKEHYYFERFKSTRDLSEYFEDKDWLRLYKTSDDVVMVFKDRKHLFNVDVSYHKDYHVDWFQALCRVYTNGHDLSKGFTIDVSYDTDRWNNRIHLRTLDGKSIGRGRTKKDAEFRDNKEYNQKNTNTFKKRKKV